MRFCHTIGITIRIAITIGSVSLESIIQRTIMSVTTGVAFITEIKGEIIAFAILDLQETNVRIMASTIPSASPISTLKTVKKTTL